MALLVNGELISDAVLRHERAIMKQRTADAFDSSYDPVSANQWIESMVQERVVAQTVFRQAALEDTAPITEEVLQLTIERLRERMDPESTDEQVRREAEEHIRAAKLMMTLTAGVQKPSRKDVDLYYKTHRSQFHTEERVRVQQIVKNVTETFSRDEAMALMVQAEEELRAGGVFADLAAKYSDCPANGGNLGWIERDQMVEEFEAVAFSLSVDQRSPIFDSPFGLHLIEVTGRKSRGIEPLSQIREELLMQIWKDRKQRVIERFTRELAEKAVVTTVKNETAIAPAQ